MEVKKRIFFVFATYIDLKKFLPFWCQVEVDTVHVARQGSGADKEDDKNKIGEQGGEIYELYKIMIL